MGGKGKGKGRGRRRPRPRATHPGPTHTAGEDTGGSLVEVEGADTAHAIGDEGQHVAARRRTMSGGSGHRAG